MSPAEHANRAEPATQNAFATARGDTRPRPAPTPAHLLLGLQRSAGNSAVGTLIEETQHERSPVLDILAAGTGRPLEPDLREDMESRMGADFSTVRIHTGAGAAASAEAVGARAYTVGDNIVFGSAGLDAASETGRKTLAHELTHVIQQRSGPVDGTPIGGGISVSDPSDRFEREADATAQRVLSGPAEGQQRMAVATSQFAEQQASTMQRKEISEREGLTVTVDMNQFRLQQGQCETAIGREIDRHIDAVKEGFKIGLEQFADWYTKREKAEEAKNSASAAHIFKFLLDKGLDIVFPEEAIFVKLLKMAASKGFELAVDGLGEPAAGDRETFLTGLRAAEAMGTAHLLDAHDNFFKSKPIELAQAIQTFVEARRQGWDSTEILPDQVLAILHQAGVGIHGEAMAHLHGERWLSAHVEYVLRSEKNTVDSVWTGMEQMAQIAALRQMQNLPRFDNRERMWDLEQSLPRYFQNMVNINGESAQIMHYRLDMNLTDAENIVAFRTELGPFQTTDELLTNKLLSEAAFKRAEPWLVCH